MKEASPWRQRELVACKEAVLMCFGFDILVKQMQSLHADQDKTILLLSVIKID